METNYKRGRTAEYKAVAILKQAGYQAFRTAGSHGPFDVLGLSEKHLRCIQVKRMATPPASALRVAEHFRDDIDAITDLRFGQPWVQFEIWIWTPRKGWRFFVIDSDGNLEEWTVGTPSRRFTG